MDGAALFVIVEPLAGHVVEPLLFGHSTGLSPVAVIAAATFWTWLWGPIGLILATPLTVCLVVLGRHVDRLKFLDVMLGDQPALTPAQLIYQRMLARDPVEAPNRRETILKEKPLAAYYDEVLLEGLKLAQADADRGLIGEEHMLRIRDAVAEIVDDLGAHEDEAEVRAETEAEQAPLAEACQGRERPASPPSIAAAMAGRKSRCCAFRGAGCLTKSLALMVSQLVERQGIGARAEQADALSVSRIFGLDTKDVAVDLPVLCREVPPRRRSVTRSGACAGTAPEVAILVALVGDGAEQENGPENIHLVRGSLRATVEKVLAIASESSESPGAQNCRMG